MTVGPTSTSQAESSASNQIMDSLLPSASFDRSSSPFGNKRKGPDTDWNHSADLYDRIDQRDSTHPGDKAVGVGRHGSEKEPSSRKKKGHRYHPLFDKTDDKERSVNIKNNASMREGSGQVKKRRKIDNAPDEPRESSKSDSSRRKSSSQRQRLKTLGRPHAPSPDNEKAERLAMDLKDSKEEIESLKAELAMIKEKENGTRMVLDRFEEELCCGICQESFIDPVTVQPCGHSYCGACMANYLKSYKINDKLVWTLPGDRTNLLEINHAQRKRAGELNLKTAVHKINIPAPAPNVKYNQWGEAYIDDQDSDSEGSSDENADLLPAPVDDDDDASVYSKYSDEDGSGEGGRVDSDEDSQPGYTGAEVPRLVLTEGGTVMIGLVANDEAAPVIDQPAVITENHTPALQATAFAAQAIAALDLDEAQTPEPTAVSANMSPGPAQAPDPAPAAVQAEAPSQSPPLTNPPPVAPSADPAAGPVAPEVQQRAIIAAPAIPVANAPVEVKLGEGKLSSKGLSCVFCKRTPITAIVPALALGAAADLLVKARPEFAREQDAIDDHRKTYEKGQALSFPIPVSAVPSYIAVQKAPVHIYRDRGEGGATDRYWQLCKYCPAPGRPAGTFVCPIPVPNPNRRSTRLSRDMPCPGHLLCGNCDVLTPESLAEACDGCGESACKRLGCKHPTLKNLHEPPANVEHLLYPEELPDTIHSPRFAQALLGYFRHNATEAAIFLTWVQKQNSLALIGRRPSDSYSARPRKFSPNNVFAELSIWLSSTEGVAAGGLKGLFERFGIQGGLQKPAGGTGRFCHSCGSNIFKAGLAEWWSRHYKKPTVQAVIPATIKDRVKCKWGHTCFYQANQAHAEQCESRDRYPLKARPRLTCLLSHCIDSHLGARLTDEEVAGLPEQTTPTGTGIENDHAAFQKAHAAARVQFGLDVPPMPIPAPALTPANAAEASAEDLAAVDPVPAVVPDHPPADQQEQAVVAAQADLSVAEMHEDEVPVVEPAEMIGDVVMQDPEAASHAAVEDTVDDILQRAVLQDDSDEIDDDDDDER